MPEIKVNFLDYTGMKEGEERGLKREGQKGWIAFCCDLVEETWGVSWQLIRIVIPAVILTKILDELGVIDLLSTFFDPLMAIMGLPGELALVWVTAIFTSIYGGIAVFASLAPELQLTSAQITVLASAILFAHSLPIELAVSRKAGAGAFSVGAVRIGAAVVYGVLFTLVCSKGGWLQDVPQSVFSSPPPAAGLSGWAVDQLYNILLILVIICVIILAMRLLRAIGFLGLLESLLAPVLPYFGMTGKAAPITVVGMLMGLGYGGALIIREVETGKLEKEEVFHSMLLLGLCHSLFEDTLLLAAIGGKFMGILWGRMAFSLFFLYLWVRYQRYRKKRWVKEV